MTTATTPSLREQLIAKGLIRPAPAQPPADWTSVRPNLHVSPAALMARKREAGPVAKAMAILEAAVQRDRTRRATGRRV